MRSILLSALVASLLYEVCTPIFLVYLLVVFGVCMASICLYPISLLKINLQDLGNSFSKQLHSKWTNDTLVHSITNETVALMILQFINLVFFREYVVTLLLAIGLIIVVRTLIQHIREFYLEDFKELLEQLSNGE
jgi:hypothetical protein